VVDDLTHSLIEAGKNKLALDWYVGGSRVAAGTIYFNRGDRALPTPTVHCEHERTRPVVWFRACANITLMIFR
jgi:hypothetical protein